MGALDLNGSTSSMCWNWTWRCLDLWCCCLMVERGRAMTTEEQVEDMGRMVAQLAVAKSEREIRQKMKVMLYQGILLGMAITVAVDVITSLAFGLVK